MFDESGKEAAHPEFPTHYYEASNHLWKMKTRTETFWPTDVLRVEPNLLRLRRMQGFAGSVVACTTG
jgi:hypothetical protein